MEGIVGQDFHRFLAANAYFRRPVVPQAISRPCDYECDEVGLVAQGYWQIRYNQGNFLPSVEMRRDSTQLFPRYLGFRYKESSCSLLVADEAAER